MGVSQGMSYPSSLSGPPQARAISPVFSGMHQVMTRWQESTSFQSVALRVQTCAHLGKQDSDGYGNIPCSLGFSLQKPWPQQELPSDAFCHFRLFAKLLLTNL